MKKFISLLLILALICAMTPSAFADWGSGSSGWNDPWTGGWEDYNTYSVTGTTSLANVSSAQLNNIYIASAQLASVDVKYGQKFSFNDTVGPRTSEYGYKTAVNGRGAKVRGGGVGQVATTLYLAVRQLSGISYIELDTWDERFTQTYTPSGYDAVIVDYANKDDFSFMNYAGDLHIEMWVSYSQVYCTITVGGSSTTGSMIGYASIPYSGTNTLKNNVKLAYSAIHGTRMGYYDEFSFNQTVGPRTANYGFGNAINGRGVKVMGGGVAQVASVLYMAIKDLDCIKITDKSTYGKKYNQSYVASAEDAIVTDYKANTDFCFRYTGYNTLIINMYVNSNGTRLICEIYEQ